MSKKKSGPSRSRAVPVTPARQPSSSGLQTRSKWVVAAGGILLAVGLIAAGAWWWAHRAAAPAPASPSVSAARATFVDEAGCATCHTAQHQAWTGSHHDLAMQEVSAASVSGDFSGSTFDRQGVKSRFFQRDGDFWVNTEGADSKLADFRVRDTFGVEPLQQYLLELPGGRLQALTTAWDVERERWFDLYPTERIDAHDELHWTKPAQNWNYMCAECHSTDLHKNYDAATGTYKTTFARIDVGCQACHGPGSRHLAWAERARGAAQPPATVKQMGFEVDLAARDATVQIESCARCHARRAAFWGDYRHGARLMDQHLPALLEEQLYHADGQILGEVYEYGSFLQSRMYEKGLRCSDCHDPHTAKTRAPGNALCTTCHNATGPKARASIDASGLKRKDYDSPAHHFHQVGAAGSQCVDCHMPQRTYMVVDPRHDHSFRIPRPDLSSKLGVPNACNACHTGKTTTWAATAVARWYGPDRRQETHFGEALWAGRTHQANAARRLAALARDGSQPDIARATALELLAGFPGATGDSAFRDALSHSEPLLRRAALEGLQSLPLAQRIPLVAPLLTDPVRAVRMEAGRLLASAAASEIGAARVGALNAALAELEAAQRENADRPEGHANLGSLYAAQRKPEQAVAAYRAAIELDPRFVPAYVNLADLQRTNSSEEAAERTLREGLHVVSDSAPLHHALGLSLVRQQRHADALVELARAARLAPEDLRYAYVYGIALHDVGRGREALSVLEATLRRYPGDRDLLAALESYAREQGDTKAATVYGGRLRLMEGGEGR